MFGNLVPVTSGALVDRYNRALQQLTGKKTTLDDFHIDISGYSPEIGDEFGDDQYLNPNGCNRQFIILTTAQKTAPLLNAKFSMSRPILRAFIEENEAELFALTTKDAVAGELANSVFDLSTPERLFDIRRIKVIADTTGSHVAEGRKLAEKISRFKSEEDAWWDDVLIAEMIELAKSTGDVVRNPVTLRPMAGDHGNFWTSHFGGLYIFRDIEHPAAIVVGDKDQVSDLPIAYTFDFSNRNEIAHFLELNDLVEPVVRVRGVDIPAILGQKMDFILVDIAAERGFELDGFSRRDLRTVARKYGASLPEEFHGLAALKRWAESGDRWPKIDSQHPAYFYTLRSRQHENQDLVNQLLAELAPLDIRQLFICHKQLFYDHYAGWSDTKKRYVVDFLQREYMADKVGAREALFGGDEPMEPSKSRTVDQLIQAVGPWGAFKKERR